MRWRTSCCCSPAGSVTVSSKFEKCMRSKHNCRDAAACKSAVGMRVSSLPLSQAFLTSSNVKALVHALPPATLPPPPSLVPQSVCSALHPISLVGASTASCRAKTGRKGARLPQSTECSRRQPSEALPLPEQWLALAAPMVARRAARLDSRRSHQWRRRRRRRAAAAAQRAVFASSLGSWQPTTQRSWSGAQVSACAHLIPSQVWAAPASLKIGVTRGPPTLHRSAADALGNILSSPDTIAQAPGWTPDAQLRLAAETLAPQLQQNAELLLEQASCGWA